jgi:hypothetical protein
VVGKVRRTEAGEDAEAEVEAANESSGGEARASSGDMEVGEVRADAGGEGIEVRLRETVEEEVGDDEVVRAGGYECAGVGDVRAEARTCCGVGAGGSAGEEREHRGAEVDGVGFELGVRGEESRGEAAIAVAEEESAAAVCEAG